MPKFRSSKKNNYQRKPKNNFQYKTVNFSYQHELTLISCARVVHNRIKKNNMPTNIYYCVSKYVTKQHADVVGKDNCEKRFDMLLASGPLYNGNLTTYATMNRYKSFVTQ